MGLCVALQPDGTLVPTGQSVADCTGYVLVSPAESWLTTTLTDALQPPSPEVLVGWWFGSFSLVMICYIAGKHVGAILNAVK